MEDTLDVWFKREILPHEAMLVRYLARAWPRRDEVPDLRQEVYARVYAASMVARPASPRSFLFTTARHLMVDRVRHDRVVSIEAIGDMDALNLSMDKISVERRINARQELKLLERALDMLPPKCRRVLWLRRVEGLSQKQVAERLGVTEKTVEQHVSKGGRLLARYMLSAELDRFAGGRAWALEQDEHEHGSL